MGLISNVLESESGTPKFQLQQLRLLPRGESYDNSMLLVRDRRLSPILVTSLVFVTGPPGPRNRRAPASIPRPAPVNGPGRGVFFLSPAPAPVQAPAPFNAPNSPPSMNFLRPGPRFFVYSPLEHCSFDT